MATIPELKDFFIRLVEQNALSHGYLLYGKNISKTSIIRGLGNFLETKRWENSAPLIDYFEIHSAEGGIDGLREGQQFLWKKPMRSPRRLFVVRSLSSFSLVAQNVLLKITEDAPPHALIVVVEENAEVLPLPLQSRLQKVYVSQSNIEKESAEEEKTARAFLKASKNIRKEIIVDVLERGKEEELLEGILLELSRDTIRNWRDIKEILSRLNAMKQFNTNKKLQLEAAILNL